MVLDKGISAFISNHGKRFLVTRQDRPGSMCGMHLNIPDEKVAVLPSGLQKPAEPFLYR
jgi:hypothetical protein